MAVKRVIKGVQVVPMGKANTFLIEGDDGLTLIDAGYPGKEAAVQSFIRCCRVRPWRAHRPRCVDAFPQ
jgi:hypothetical protein